uniref:ATP synthase complex subunit 8 n=1 Tax=Pygovepres vaccinicola TaxID=981301 RepID=A0A514LNS6_9HEMI|nr:ATP synthase F0 subunit 8 [Pygovepres vaccinicola]QDI93430.1 ATP synthase F0 subunit 8 [Pygovepres vaccinicola]QDI93443.1 ATP synthase F0 subunit 8 [Pygovepres vaccinicola]QDI93456.1 ATP synthase F0 subunit 8 [Pygovepres vaccinicola]QDI93469.1 ATP synthase F0 subunit 8 [Pygovepres vaccinicola]
MPQMAPIWWFTLFLMFIMTYFIFMVFLYFYNIYQLKMKMMYKNTNIKNINWKW